MIKPLMYFILTQIVNSLKLTGTGKSIGEMALIILNYDQNGVFIIHYSSTNKIIFTYIMLGIRHLSEFKTFYV